MKYFRAKWVAAAVVIVIILAAVSLWMNRSSFGTIRRVRHALLDAGFPSSIGIEMTKNGIILSGSISTKERYVAASEITAGIVGDGKVVNNLYVEKRPIRDVNTRLGILDIAIDTRYDDSPESLKEVSVLTELPQFEELKVASATTLSQLIFDRFGFGPGDLPKSYELIESSILQRNNLAKPELLQVGSLKIPILPRRTPIFDHTPPPASPNPQPGIIGYGIVSSNFEIGTGLQQVSKSLPTGSTRYVIQVPFTRQTLEQTKQIAANLLVNIPSYKIKIDLASTQQGKSSHRVLDTEDLAAVKAALSRPIKRDATVFIIDSGWPDASTYASSLLELHRLVNLVTDSYGLARTDQTDKPFTALPQDSDSIHAAEIRDALQEFTDLDKTKAVKIVYVPMTLQQNSSGILKELLEAYYITMYVKGKKPLADTIVRDAEIFADQSLQYNIADKITGNSFDTEAALIEAVWAIADSAADHDPRGGVFFINESWTVDEDSKQPSHAGTSSGVSVAAVGNTQGRVVNSRIGYFDFAGQCATTKSVIAVLDVKPNGTLFCKSSELDGDTLDASFAAGFDGEVSDGGLCGSSFSSPRLAWLLALGEATRSRDLDNTKWVIYLQNKLMASRRPSSDRWQHLYAHPVDLLRNP